MYKYTYIYIYIYGKLQKFEHGPGTRYAGCPSSLGFGVGGESYSDFLASTVGLG